ncbi:gluconokinase-like [Macadamia integrifolia]|uniref:gluconokinase-like n=1 Tax=Macadamia integrifolia TaxID=60698 RepID=UPI001C500559|nr:gluconokinase-like [Macadamia integrifolia]
MDSTLRGLAVVIMGVSGSGKSTIGALLGKAVNCSFLDADDFHPQSNKEKMGKGIPLSEEDRIPWLETLRDTLQRHISNSKNVILACSALQKRYREILRMADPDYNKLTSEVGGGGGGGGGGIKFVLLDAAADVLAARLKKREEEGNHYMPASLLRSQLDLLQIDMAEGIFTVDATLSADVIVHTIMTNFLFK